MCVVAAASGYPESPRKGDILTIKLKENESIQLFHAGTTRDEEGRFFTSGGRVLSLVAQGKTFDEAFYLAYNALKDINFNGMIYRCDIGHQVLSMKSPQEKSS